ncbi:aminopeptidase N [Sorex fumeus]|uniref:aminopeptidase N n=1 Tax=Sorex fumeus TaxID=62283 RepID=UPI0024ACB9E9|nr:aminopeptidase N [Sorex fumeus]
MAGGFLISKPVGILCIILGVGAVSTIIALSVVYSQEKSKNAESPPVPTPPPATTTPDPSLPWNQYRLPKTLIPHSYKVSLRPFLSPNSQGLYVFHGSSTVRFECQAATNVVIIHSKKLNYTADPVLRSVDGSQAPEISRWELVKLTEYLVLHLKNQLQPGKFYEMDTRFVGELADDLAGFYRSEYMDGGVKKVVATTQMQAADARKSFPCFDEPAMKAMFNITLIHPNNLTALSNMMPKDTRPYHEDTNWNITEFQSTPVMSTYLLAYIVSEFDKVEAKSSGGVQIRIWGRPSAIKAGHGNYALNVTGPILDFFAKHYSTSYPLSKSDQIALPDFNAGAMENWGLVTYRENSLLFDPVTSSIGNKERVVTVIGHELAHQWFGNLVTVAWWNDLWLNEGFASYVEYLGANDAEPTWNLKDLMVPNELYRVMAVDALASSHPLSTPADEVKTPAQISELFDSISYSKGASVLRMLSTFLTEDIFKEGLASYLHAFAYSNTVYQDLWDHLQQAVDKHKYVLPSTVKDIMDRWILQMGFPVITVDTTTGSISQKHFLLDPDSNVTRPSPFEYLWIVPITSMKKGVSQNHYWMEDVKTAQTDLFKMNNDEWLLLNLDVTGYFQVNYDEANWKKLQNQLTSDLSVIPVINRAQIIHDAFTLSNAGIVSVTLALDNTMFLNKDIEYMPWQAAIDSLSYYKLMFDRSNDVYVPMKNYLKKQVTHLFNHFKNVTNNWTLRPQTLMDQYNEVNAISTACSNGLEDCHTFVTELYKRWMQNPTDNRIIHPNLRSAVYCNAIALGGDEEWEFAWKQFRNATVVNEADKLRAALACSTNIATLERYLNYALDPNYIRKQDATSTISSIASNVQGQTLTWMFVKFHWKKLFNDFGGGSFSFSNLIQAVTRRFNTEYDLQQLEEFKKENMDTGFGSATRALEQALEKTKANIKWVNKNKVAIKDWFTAHQ